MAVYTEKKTYQTKAHMGMIDVTEDFQHAVSAACREHGISAGTVTGFTTGGCYIPENGKHGLHHRGRGGADHPGV